MQPTVVRNTSATTTSTVATASTSASSRYTDGDTLPTPASSATTTLDRGNSHGSYVSRTDSTSGAPPPPAKPVSQATSCFEPGSSGAGAGPSGRSWKDNDIIRTLQDIKRPLQVHEGYEDSEFYDDDDQSDDDGDDRFFNPALLSHIAVRLRDKVPRGTHVKGSIPYERAFTGKDIVVCGYPSWVT